MDKCDTQSSQTLILNDDDSTVIEPLNQDNNSQLYMKIELGLTFLTSCSGG